jgi:hypothetical protein
MNRWTIGIVVVQSLMCVQAGAQSPRSLAEPVVASEVEEWRRAVEYTKVDPGTSETQLLMSLSPTERQGAFLFKQRCNACHYSMEVKHSIGGAVDNTKLNAGDIVFAPLLSKRNVEGREDVVRQRITDGSARMPAFKYGLSPEQIDAIVSYLKKKP